MRLKELKLSRLVNGLVTCTEKLNGVIVIVLTRRVRIYNTML